MGQTIVEKIVQKHMTEGPTRPLRTGDFLSIRPHRCMTHDNTSAVMSKFKGIGPQIMVERGYVVPGSFVVASDSHSNMYGALGAIGTPIVRTDAAAVWATGEFWWQIPRSIQVVLEGKLPDGVTGKDVIVIL